MFVDIRLKVSKTMSEVNNEMSFTESQKKLAYKHTIHTQSPGCCRIYNYSSPFICEQTHLLTQKLCITQKWLTSLNTHTCARTHINTMSPFLSAINNPPTHISRKLLLGLHKPTHNLVFFFLILWLDCKAEWQEVSITRRGPFPVCESVFITQGNSDT